MCLSMDLWHSSNMKVVLQKFAMDHCFWTLWTLNYVNYIPFSCINSFHMAHNKLNNFKENFILEFSEKHDQTSSLWKGSHKNSPIHLSIFHLPACDAFFSGSIQWSFFIFLHEDILPYILKRDKSRF